MSRTVLGTSLPGPVFSVIKLMSQGIEWITKGPLEYGDNPAILSRGMLRLFLGPGDAPANAHGGFFDFRPP